MQLHKVTQMLNNMHDIICIEGEFESKMATAGLIMGVVFLVISIVLLAYWVPKLIESYNGVQQAQEEYDQTLLEQEQAFEELNQSVEEITNG